MEQNRFIVIFGVDIFDNYNAGSIRVKNLFETLINNSNYQIVNILSHDENRLIREKKLFNVNTISFRGFTKYLKLFIFLYSNKKKFKSRFIYNYGSISVNNVIVILAARCFKYNVIFDIVENSNVKVDLISFSQTIKYYFTKYLEKRLYFFADGCVVISQRLLSLISDVANNRFPVKHITISIKLSEWVSGLNKSTPKSKKVIFYGGSFGEKNGLQYLIKAFDKVVKKVPNVELRITSTGAKRYYDLVCKGINNLENKKNVVMLGKLERADYVNEVLNSDVVCVPRINSALSNFGFPFKLGEYLAAGKAIIATNTSDVSCYLEHKRDVWLINPESVEALENALFILLTNREIREKLEVNAKLCAENYFDSTKVSLDFKHFIDSFPNK